MVHGVIPIFLFVFFNILVRQFRVTRGVYACMCMYHDISESCKRDFFVQGGGGGVLTVSQIQYTGFCGEKGQVSKKIQSLVLSVGS